jgi:hypothetical protein
MRPENEARLRRIRLISEILRVICGVFLGLIALGFVASLFSLVTGKGPSGGSNRAEGALLAVICGLGFNCGYHLYRLLGNYSRGEIFTRDSAGQIRQWGIACVLLGGWKFALLFVPLARLPAEFKGYMEPGQGLDWVVNGLIIVAISWFMAMAAEMREEQDLIV